MRRRCAKSDHPRSRGEYRRPKVNSLDCSGSSPLSRGIRRVHAGQCGRSRIIPALAGNTAKSHTRSPPAPDHPRSRGEYHAPTRSHVHRWGSSPLSRGIPRLLPVHIDAARIIPALAGNTLSRGLWQLSAWDHPRSRGEYVTWRLSSCPPGGSSPLSRGIHKLAEKHSVAVRIIPALAGNTRLPARTGAPQPDHPRSRGEYRSPGTTYDPTTGSSPLSRGILGEYGLMTQIQGIIPALAGNTRIMATPYPNVTDHPRSRGEYSRIPSAVLFAPGSSPLSRGIQISRMDCSLRPGIIPALAGNTRGVPPHRPRCAGSSPLSRGIHGDQYASGLMGRIIPALAGNTPAQEHMLYSTWDHPRSRGEYGREKIFFPPGSGSSPLSRGIRRSSPRHPRSQRIIPALAGNTGIIRTNLQPMGDHPRSRGEYALQETSYPTPGGSSPLSRGILFSVEILESTERIIPALAGNTQPPPGWSGRQSDHPRSRGEYVSRSHATTSAAGSSPLSRGIRLSSVLLQRLGRIIPALAGNTKSRRRMKTHGADHPRSRGEYHSHGRLPDTVCGSSPLSRGIPMILSCVTSCSGIIPALAGNTLAPSVFGGLVGDHPRSRGEYRFTSSRSEDPPGSSPLSRGILQGLTREPKTSGIIPALAGNTCLDPRYLSPGADHPRSRGEYSLPPGGTWPLRGSSPLSRGILPEEPKSSDCGGIIPALAGNTGFRTCGHPPSRDHPRSRGEYG